MDVSFINPVLDSMVKVMQTMAGVDPVAGRPRIKKNCEVSTGNVTGLMSMMGSHARASVAITFTEPVILKIANKMLQGDRTSLDGMVIDLVGEMANMVIGGAKHHLEEQGHMFDLSLPTVIIGKEYLVSHKTKGPTFFVPFAISEGKFFIEAAYEEFK